MMVAFDSGTRLGAPIEVGDVLGGAAVAPAAFPSNADPSFQTSDLIVLQSTSTSPALTILLGNAQRVLIPYYDPRSNASRQLDRAPHDRRRVVQRRYQPRRHRARDAEADPTSWETRAWGIPGPITTFPDTKTDGTVVAGAVDCSHDFGTGFCAEDASYLAWPATGHDIVLGVDHGDHVARVDPVGSSAGLDRDHALAPPMGARRAPAPRARISTATARPS